MKNKNYGWRYFRELKSKKDNTDNVFAIGMLILLIGLALS